MSDNHVHSEISRLGSQVAALEQLLDVQEQTALEQADRLEHALQFREKAEEELKEERNALREIVSQQQLIDTIRELSAPLRPSERRLICQTPSPSKPSTSWHKVNSSGVSQMWYDSAMRSRRQFCRLTLTVLLAAAAERTLMHAQPAPHNQIWLPLVTGGS